jgi:hypothetical protein
MRQWRPRRRAESLVVQLDEMARFSGNAVVGTEFFTAGGILTSAEVGFATFLVRGWNINRRFQAIVAKMSPSTACDEILSVRIPDGR